MSESIMCYIAPGKMIDLAAPDMESITIDHIAASLSKLEQAALGAYLSRESWHDFSAFVEALERLQLKDTVK